MEKDDISERFIEFLNEFYKDEILKAVDEGKKYLDIDFSLLDKFDIELSDYLLENPEETVSIAEESIKQIEAGLTETKLRLRFFNLPESRNIRIRNVRSEHIGKMIVIDGIVKRASEIRPEVSETVFQCPECGTNISVIQTERIIRSPIECDSCKNRRGFRLVSQKLYDARWVVVEEPFEIVTGERPSELGIYLKEDLTSPRMQNKTDPGNRIKVTGVLKELPKRIKGTRSRQMDIYLDAGHVESVEMVWEELEISEEDEKKIVELSKDPLIFQKLIGSLAPSMYEMDEVKEAIILQMFGGEPKLLKDGTRIRGNIHVLLVGDPSSGKSQIMQLTSKMMPRGKYVSGSGITAAGITATVIKDEELGGWVLEAGALVMANRSICCIDEFSKVAPPDRIALQEAMSMETISIAKASIVATLPAQTAVLAGGNPKLGRFDPYIPIREQVDVDDVLLSRFDLRFALRDIPNVELDTKMADHILKMRHFHEEEAIPLLSTEFLRKYISYARSRAHPALTKEAGERLKEFYLEMRAKAGEDAPVSITLRQYEALIRVAEASAKIRLSVKVDAEDVERSIRLMKISLRQFGFEPETGRIDIDRAEGMRVTSAQRSKIRIMLDVIDELTNTYGKDIPVDELNKRARAEGIDDAEEIIRKMQTEAILYSPKTGFVSKA